MDWKKYSFVIRSKIRQDIVKALTTEKRPSDLKKELKKEDSNISRALRELQKNGINYFTLTRFHKPAEIKNEGILFLEHESGENDVLMYLPTYKKIRRVESQSQSSSFMGSVFSYSDITTQHVDDYQYSETQEEPCPGTPSVKCYRIEAKPAKDSVRERTGYSRSVHWIRQDNFMSAAGDNYDEQGLLWKKFESTDIREIDPGRHKWMAFRIRMEDRRGKRFTLLEFRDVKVNAPIKAGTFTEENLARE